MNLFLVAPPCCCSSSSAIFGRVLPKPFPGPYQGLSKALRCQLGILRLDMRRRDFFGFACGAAAAWPFPVYAQSAEKRISIGILHSGSQAAWAPILAGFRSSLAAAGFIEGDNLALEYGWAEDRFDRLPRLAEDLVRRRVALIFAGGGEISTLAAKSA